MHNLLTTQESKKKNYSEMPIGIGLYPSAFAFTSSFSSSTSTLNEKNRYPIIFNYFRSPNNKLPILTMVLPSCIAIL